MSLDTKLQSIFRDVFDNDTLAFTDSISQQTFADWDSFHQVKLVIAIEEEFGVKLTTEEAISWTSGEKLKAGLASKGIAN